MTGFSHAIWAAIVGEETAHASRPIGVIERALVIDTSDANWAHQLSFQERAIIGKLVALGMTVDRLRFRHPKANASKSDRVPRYGESQ